MVTVHDDRQKRLFAMQSILSFLCQKNAGYACPVRGMEESVWRTGKKGFEPDREQACFVERLNRGIIVNT